MFSVQITQNKYFASSFNTNYFNSLDFHDMFGNSNLRFGLKVRVYIYPHFKVIFIIYYAAQMNCMIRWICTIRTRGRPDSRPSGLKYG